MRKRNLFASCLLLGALVTGCNDNIVDTEANISFENTSLSNNKGEKLTAGALYDYMMTNQKDDVSKILLSKIMEQKIDFSKDEMKTLYKKYLNEYFNKTFVENQSYKLNGEFNEEILYRYLLNEGYLVKCGSGVSSGDLDSTIFSCDYSDFIKRELEYDIYLKVLKVKYVLEDKPDMINKSDARKVTYYTIVQDSGNNDVRNLLEEYVKSIELNHDSDNEELIRNISDIAEAKRKKDLEKISEEYAYLSTSQDSSSGYTYLNKFTTCGENRCSIEEGKAYQEKQIMDKEYYSTKIVTNDNTDILYEDARTVLFSDNVMEHTLKIGDANYLISPSYYDAEDKRINDIIMFDAETKNYYIATVETITSSTESFEDRVAVAEILIDRISDSLVFNDCYDDLTIVVYDKAILEHFEDKYGNPEK